MKEGFQPFSQEVCESRFFAPDFHYRRNIRIETQSALPSHYTINVKVDHKALVDENKASSDGKDLRVFYLPDKKGLPYEIDRVVSGLYTTKAHVQFRIQKMIPSNTVDGSSYALVFGGRNVGKAKSDPKKVFAFFEDFSDSTLNRWTRVWGEWTVKNGAVFGKTGKSTFGHAEVGLYLDEGKDWGDIEVELDLMETGSATVYPGPFLRVLESNLQYTTAWWFEYYTDRKDCTMRPFMLNRDGSWKYKCQLPNPLVKNKWFHFRYRVTGNRISQWANEVLIQTATVDSEWMIPRGTIALGCHGVYSGSPHGCRSFYDNIKVQLLVDPKPTVSVEDRCQVNCQRGLPFGTKEHPADSCKQIHDSNLSNQKTSSAKNGVYWIKSSLKCSDGIQTFCDMKNGGWTLVGKINGHVGNIYSKWLVKNVNTGDLKTPKIDSGKTGYSSLDARLLAVKHASEVMLSSGDNAGGIGSKWVQWQLPSGREYNTWWNHGVGQSTVQAAGTSQVTVKAWNGNTKDCFQNRYGIMPFGQHGGSYPYASFNSRGNTKVTDYCMAIGVMLQGSRADGWSQNANGFDSPNSDSDWPNGQYNHQSPCVLVWLK
ncbi:hypothetical protein ACROYT_G003952 [Oculina patagonica]